MKKISTHIMTFRYLTALGLLALLSLASYYILQENIRAQKTNAAVVNVSGRQRMLSQRIAMKAHHLTMKHSDDELKEFRQQLIEAINIMEKSHAGLINGDQDMSLPGRPSPEVRAIFFSSPLHLDKQIKKYLSEAKKIADTTLPELADNNPHLDYLKVKSDEILIAIDTLVKQYQQESEAGIERLQQLEIWVLTTVLIVLAVIALFIFHPMVLRIRQETRELELAEERSRTIMEMVADGIIIVNEEGIIESFNRAAERFFGYPASHVTGKNIDILMPGPHNSKHHNKIDEYINGGTVKLPIVGREIVGQRQDGSTIPLAVSVSETKIENQRLFISSMQDITERKKMEEQLKEMAITDELTGLFNRRGFLTLSEKHCSLAERNKRPMSIIYVDVNKMKLINDELGHMAGDQALVDTGSILNSSFRKSDIIGRIGGDEFAVLLTEHSEQEIETTLNSVYEHITLHNKEVKRKYELSLSLGVAHYDPEHPSSICDLLSKADALMYENKKFQNSEKRESPIKEDMSERRFHRRFPTTDNCWAEISGSGKVLIKDISIGGICLITSEQFTPDSINKIKLFFPDDNNLEPVSVSIWSYPKEGPVKNNDVTYYNSGFKFIEMNDSMINSLKNIIRQFTRQKRI